MSAFSPLSFFLLSSFFRTDRVACREENKRKQQQNLSVIFFLHMLLFPVCLSSLRKTCNRLVLFRCAFLSVSAQVCCRKEEKCSIVFFFFSIFFPSIFFLWERVKEGEGCSAVNSLTPFFTHSSAFLLVKLLVSFHPLSLLLSLLGLLLLNTRTERSQWSSFLLSFSLSLSSSSWRRMNGVAVFVWWRFLSSFPFS